MNSLAHSSNHIPSFLGHVNKALCQMTKEERVTNTLLIESLEKQYKIGDSRDVSIIFIIAMFKEIKHCYVATRETNEKLNARVQKLKAEFSSLEKVSNAVEEKFKAEFSKLEAELNQSQNERQVLHDQVNAIKSSLEEAKRKSLIEIQLLHNQVNEANSSLQAAKSASREEKQQLKNQITNAEQNTALFQSQLERTQNQLVQKNNELEALNAILANEEDEMATLKDILRRERLGNLAQKIRGRNRLREELKTVRAKDLKIHGLLREAEESQAQINDLKRKNAEMEETHAAKRIKVDALLARLNSEMNS